MGEVKGARKKAFEDAMTKVNRSRMKVGKRNRFKNNPANQALYLEAVESATELRDQCQQIMNEYKEDGFSTRPALRLRNETDTYITTAHAMYAKAVEAQNKGLRNLSGPQRLSSAERGQVRAPGRGFRQREIAATGE